MSHYTTGEIAKLCGVTVRTVQYYDSRGVLIPSALSEGGRRLYSDDDLKRLKVICFLRELDLPINSIIQLLQEDHPGSVVSLLLDRQEQELNSEIQQLRSKLNKLEALKRELKSNEHFSVESIGDIAYQLENKKNMHRFHMITLSFAIAMEILEAGLLFLWICKGIWWPFAVGIPLILAVSIWFSILYLRQTAYICPQCHSVFKPAIRDAFLANHTTNARKLTCTCCGHRGFCVETYGGNINEQNKIRSS